MIIYDPEFNKQNLLTYDVDISDDVDVRVIIDGYGGWSVKEIEIELHNIVLTARTELLEKFRNSYNGKEFKCLNMFRLVIAYDYVKPYGFSGGFSLVECAIEVDGIQHNVPDPADDILIERYKAKVLKELETEAQLAILESEIERLR